MPPGRNRAPPALSAAPAEEKVSGLPPSAPATEIRRFRTGFKGSMGTKGEKGKTQNSGG
jgi:hypothetical protein